MQKTPYVFPIIGGRKIENLVDNLEALDISLSDEHIKFLEDVLPFDVGFPTNSVVSYYPAPTESPGIDVVLIQGDGTEPMLLKTAAHTQRLPYPKALRP